MSRAVLIVTIMGGAAGMLAALGRFGGSQRMAAAETAEPEAAQPDGPAKGARTPE